MARKLLGQGDVDALRALLWAPLQLTPPDVARWYQQGFTLQPSRAAFPLGLVQGHGGPCGVLAAVQAELVRLWLFPDTRTHTPRSIEQQAALLTEPVDEEAQRLWLARALASLLYTCAGGAPDNPTRLIRLVIDQDENFEHIGGDDTAPSEREYVEHEIAAISPVDESLVQRVVALLPAFQSRHGVVMFMFSALQTKGVTTVREEMDDNAGTLTAQFGHCSQELLNLLLTGVASSNVFDGSVPMGDTGLMLRGVQQRPRLGYLTQLEALRYCQVGNYYKSPMFPVWVIGSSSHFSVAFGLDADLCEESTSQMLYQRIQRVFKSFDPMEAGFIEVQHLLDSLKQLGVAHEILSNEFWMGQLLNRLEVSGAGIILWDEYWKVVSVLVHTRDLETALDGTYRAALPGTAQGASSARPKSDEEVARELQAMFDAEDGGTAAVGTREAPPQNELPTDKKIDIFYYNGLFRASIPSVSETDTSYPPLVRATMKLTATIDFVGASIPIEVSTATGIDGNNGSPLEEILKTKWPGAQFCWADSRAPRVD